jgi:GH35 family endo-1,4-beta-xylanase
MSLKSLTRTLLFLTLIFSFPQLVTAQNSILSGGDWYFATPHAGDANIETGTVAGAPNGGTVAEVTITVPSSNPWDIQIIRGIPTAVPTGDIVHLHFWARSKTNNPITVVLEQSVQPYNWVSSQTITLTPEWQEYSLDATSPGYGPGGLMAQFQLGRQAGVVDVTGETAVDQGTDKELAEAQTDLQPDQITARINKYRKGDLTIRVLNAAGEPVSSATVKIEQTRHAFLFGCNLLGLAPWDTSAIQATYQARFAALFNYGNVPFFWNSFEPSRGQLAYPRIDSIVKWCTSNNITMVGHPLVWQFSLPDWLPADPSLSGPVIHQHLIDTISHYKDSIHTWVVINEANSSPDTNPPNGESNWVKSLGPATAVGQALDWAKVAGNGAEETYLYNDFDTSQTYIDLLTKLQAENKLPDIIGVQSHMHTGNWPMTKLWEVCKNFGSFGRPIDFTETTVLSGENRNISFPGPDATDWNTTPDGEQKQADYVAQFYSVLFSNPSVHAISWWDLSDQGAWLGAPAGLLRKDMSPKPAYNRLMDLIHNQWWTNTTGATDTNGSYTSRVFYGDYTITATSPTGKTVTQTITFPESAPPKTIVVKI